MPVFIVDFPDGHDLQMVALDISVYVPTAHLVHGCKPVGEYSPGLHVSVNKHVK